MSVTHRRALRRIAGGQTSWWDELIVAITIYREVQTLKAKGASGELDLSITATVKATGQTIALPGTIPIYL
jgi:hypothetical protein